MKYKHEDYSVGWICALPNTELPVAQEMLDEEHETLDKSPGDSNMYSYGSIGSHNVVIACLPSGRYGVSSATEVAQNMHRTFPSLRIKLMVGIGGGLPNAQDDIRLGDIVVSRPAKGHGGVVQYDMGKATDGGNFEVRGHLNSPPTELLNALSTLQSRHVRKEPELIDHLSKLLENRRMAKKFSRPTSDHDVLSPGIAKRLMLKPQNGSTDSAELQRSPRDEPIPHYGLIASGNEVVASVEEATRIESLVGRGDPVLCFEMEAAGLMNDFHCVVIRGISDYADSLKNDNWQPYAAAAAAAYAKELLNIIPKKSLIENREKAASSKASRNPSRQSFNNSGAITVTDSHFVQGNINGRSPT